MQFSYDNRNRLTHEWTTGDEPAGVAFDLSYAYDQNGNRETMTDNLADPDIVTTYRYDVQVGNLFPITYKTWGNRLLCYCVRQGETLLEKTWFSYNLGGQARRKISLYPEQGEDYYVTCLQYNTANQLWLARQMQVKRAGDPLDDFYCDSFPTTDHRPARRARHR